MSTRENLDINCTHFVLRELVRSRLMVFAWFEVSNLVEQVDLDLTCKVIISYCCRREKRKYQTASGHALVIHESLLTLEIALRSCTIVLRKRQIFVRKTKGLFRLKYRKKVRQCDAEQMFLFSKLQRVRQVAL